MSVRRNTTNRLTLFRTCGTCGHSIVTSADTPWVRQVERDGKKQATTYFCCEGCFAASYKHIGLFDGKAQERRRAREAARDNRERNRRYYAAHAEEIRAKKRLSRLIGGQNAADCTGTVHWLPVVEDVKSRATRTAKYEMKKKLLRERFGLAITEV